jgi:prepilin-type processing-associated H-X9-DG protein
VTIAAANSAAITFVNTATKPANVFFADGAVELAVGRLAFPTDQGAKIMTATSKNGVPLIMSSQFNHLTAKTSVRFTSLYATTVLQPELAGIIIANQT